MRATEILKEEHTVINRMLRVLETLADKTAQGEDITAQTYREAIDFIRTFADRCHHGKEEDKLFVMLERCGIPRQGGPVGVMLAEHDQGRAYVRGLADAVARYEDGDEDARHAIVSNARGYIELLTQHIDKENNILYPMGDSAMSQQQQEELLRRFEDVEEDMGEDTHQRMLALVNRLEGELGLVEA